MSTNNGFGAFFRASRKALGLTLSEFCRQNGFDKGNISRLERGLVPPPQSQELLESYAKALKLESETVSSDRFFELAAAETGRIPADLLENQRTMQKLPGIFRQVRASGQGHTNWVSALDLERWADILDARTTLPQLVRRLIRATGKAIGPIELPAHEQVQRPGWDGIVVSGEANEFVPTGTSAWELGVEKDPRKKAEDDFAKRTEASLGLARKETTFVFVTPRKWQKKAEWRRTKQALGIWKEVRVYDSATLEEWLEQSPAVDAWLAGIVEPKKKPMGVIVLDDHWANLQAITDPSLKPQVFLTSREHQIVELKNWLEGPVGEMVIQARSPDEAIDFVAAFGQSPFRAEWFGARALIVESRDAWRSLSAAGGAGLLLIAHPSLSVEPELVAEAVRQGHRVLLSSTEEPRERVPSLQLPRAYRPHLEKALVSSGLNEASARSRARESGGSLTVLKRLLGRYSGTTPPEWSLHQHASALVPMLLAGSWDGNSTGDRLAIEKLSGQSYRDVVATADRWQLAPDPPLRRVGSRWSLVSRDDSWHFLASAVTSGDFDRLEEVALEVLAEDDPVHGLPPREKWQARFQEKRSRYSQTLHNGLSETLAILGARPEPLPNVPASGDRVEHIIQTLLDRPDWLRWVSLSDQLPLLAEASPEAFLKAVERDLKRAGSALMKLFEQEDDLIWPTNKHAGLIQALEVLAWDCARLPQVSMILATLDEKMPRDRSGINPSRSLREIFMPLSPQTTAPIDERVRVLKKLAYSRRDAGWRLLFGLLPNQQSISVPIHRPTWRNWALDWSGGVPIKAYLHQVDACAHLLVELMGNDLDKWKALVKQFENLPDPVQTEFIERLSGLAEKSLDQETRRAVSDAIREKVSWHRRFRSTEWALSAEILEKLETLRNRFEPEDPVRKNAWLFGPRWNVLETLEGRGEHVDELRRSALREILDTSGWEGIERLIQEVIMPEEAGGEIAEFGSTETEARIFPDFLVRNDEKAARFVRGYIRVRFQSEGWDWVNQLQMDQWSAEKVARILVDLPFERRTWEFAAAKGNDVAAFYWRNARPFTHPQNVDETRYAAARLLEHQRPSGAIHVLQMALQEKATIEPSLLMEALQTWLEPAVGDREAGLTQGVTHAIQILLRELQKRSEQDEPGVDRNRLARLELDYLELLDGRQTFPVTLHRLLRDDPAFFIEVLALAFPSEKDLAEGIKEFSEQEKHRIQNAYRLLRSWQVIPGNRDDQTVDETALLDWVYKARSLARVRGLIDFCDSQIGEVLAYAPHAEDGSWPCIPVRDILEEIDSDEVFQGLSAGIYRRRGMHPKSRKEGGAQERGLAEKYRAFADASKIDWPGTAKALRDIAKAYDVEARREDERSSLDD